MATEGMVDALRSAAAVLAHDGVMVDIHPTPEPARLEILDGDTLTAIADRIDDGTPNGPRQRHAAADAAIASCIASGILRCEAATEFSFWTQADAVRELRDYLGLKWKQLHFDEADFRRAAAALTRAAGRTVVVTERVTASKLVSSAR